METSTQNKKTTFVERMKQIIIDIACVLKGMNGVFIPKERELPEELKEFYISINNMKMNSPATDRQNMRGDYVKIVSDFRRAKHAYFAEHKIDTSSTVTADV